MKAIIVIESNSYFSDEFYKFFKVGTALSEESLKEFYWRRYPARDATIIDVLENAIKIYKKGYIPVVGEPKEEGEVVIEVKRDNRFKKKKWKEVLRLYDFLEEIVKYEYVDHLTILLTDWVNYLRRIQGERLEVEVNMESETQNGK